MVTTTTLIGIGESLARLGVSAERAPRMPKNRVTAARLLRMSHGSEVGRAVPSVSRGPADSPTWRTAVARRARLRYRYVLADHSMTVSGFDRVLAERFSRLALNCVHREYPNKLAHHLSSDADV